MTDTPISNAPARDAGLPSLRTVRLRRSAFAFCPVCEKPVELLGFADAAELFKTDLQDIEFLAGRGELHRVHNNRATVLICSDSLFTCFESRQTRLLTFSIKA